MSGSIRASLIGKVVPTQAMPLWDHTYVTSTCGWVWRCWGNYTNGTDVCDAAGSSYLANCISHPRGTAGIAYGKTGVCHQTANRILSPALVRVERARGYQVSERMFGHYGTGQWPAPLLHCLSLPPGSQELIQFDELDEQEIFIFGKAHQMFEDRRGPLSPEEIIKFASIDRSEREALDHLLWSAGIDDLSEDEKLNLVYMTRSVRDQQASLRSLLDRFEIDDKTYLEKFRDLTKDFLKKNLTLLGSKRFEAIYGETGYESDGLIDKEVFFENQINKDNILHPESK